MLDRLGVRDVDCYGHHAGAQIACALAMRAADRVRAVILDGVALFSDDRRREFQDRYAPLVESVASGDYIAKL